MSDGALIGRRYRRVPETVTAYRLARATCVVTPLGTMAASRGDFIIVRGPGRYEVVAAAEFQRQYEAADPDAVRMVVRPTTRMQGVVNEEKR